MAFYAYMLHCRGGFSMWATATTSKLGFGSMSMARCPVLPMITDP